MDFKDYYQVMGLKREASEKDIKMAYRRLARKYHPDLSKEPNAEEKFKALGEAYEVLKDPVKRKQYDQYAQDSAFNRQAKQQAGAGGWDQNRGEPPFTADFFESLFGGARGRAAPATGGDYHSSVQISLEEACRGTVKELHFAAEPGGAGKQTLRVKIPAGVKSEQKIRLPGQGAPGGQGGRPGDLYLTIHVDPHPVFDVVGNDIYVTLPVAPWEAALGATVVVPTLAGPVDLKIPPSSQGGQTLRLKKRGLPLREPGDQYVILKIVTPKPTTDAAKDVYKKMAETMPFNPREKMGV